VISGTAACCNAVLGFNFSFIKG